MGAAELLERWRDDLASWAIPEEITSAVPDSPWVLPRGMFARRAESQLAEPGGRSFGRAWEALSPPGSVLDVGAGVGAASLPLAPRATSITAVDVDEGMLSALAERAERMGKSTRLVRGRWPDVAAEVPAADVVTCHHVFYNVPDLEPFVTALSDHARRRVVAEVTARHPLTALNPLWERFHGLRRPTSPTADDAVTILRAMGLDPTAERWARPGGAEYERFEDLVDVTRRRLCLPPERAGDVADALLDLGVDPEAPRDLGSSGREVVTIWWAGTAGPPE